MEINRVHITFLSLSLCFILLLGCTAIEFRRTKISSNDFSANAFSKVELNGNDNNVTMKDINAYLHFKTLAYDKKAVSVEPLADGEDTLLYVINYEDGWEMVAGDKRAPVHLAYGESGSFSSETENVEMLAWIESLAADVQALKHLEDFSSCSEEQLFNMQKTKSFWALISGDLEDLIPKTRAHDDTLPTYPGSGHWELKNTYTTTEVFDDFRLMQTEWGQSSSHYNEYCPLKTVPSDNPRVPAGCVAVAGAQMLYYLHYNLSVPTAAPDTAYCCGDLSGFYQYADGSSTASWSYMLNNSLNYRGCYSAAVLIAKVGQLVGITYGNDGSIANTSYLPNSVFSSYGISSTYTTYSSSTVVQSLLVNMPVIVRANGTRSYDFWGNVSYGDGHAFIIDGCRRYRNIIHFATNGNGMNGMADTPYPTWGLILYIHMVLHISQILG